MHHSTTVWFAVTALLALGAGCAHKYVEKVAVMRTDETNMLTAPAPRSGMYRVQFIAGDKYVKTPLYASDRWIAKGEPLGFRRDADGTLIAIDGPEKITLGDAPQSATHVMWFHKSKKLTELGKSGRMLANLTGKTAIAVAAVVTIAALSSGSAALAVYGASDIEDFDVRAGPQKHHDHHSHYDHEHRH